MNRKLLITLLLLGAMQAMVSAQNLSSCTTPGNPTPPGATICQNSCIYCNINGFTDQNNVFLPPNNITYCQGLIALTNPRFYGFVAGSTSITFLVNYLSCNGANGLQLAILRNCSSVVECNPFGNSIGGPNTASITATGLIVGEAYQLLINGINGEVCNYQINVIAGSAIPPGMGPLGSIQGLAQVCPNGTTSYSVSPVQNAIVYTWTAPMGASINGGGNVATVPSSLGGHSVDITFGNLGGIVCVTASNACDPPVQTCMAVSNVPLPITILPDLTICSEATPFEWEEEPHTFLTAPGTYILTSTPYLSYLGCDSLVRQTVKILPQKITNLGVKYLCQDECFPIGPFEFCTPGFYTETITADNGCDSTVNVTIFKIQTNAVIQEPDTITCAVPSVTLSGVGSTTGTAVFYKWYNNNWIQINANNSITATATAPGTYHLVVQNSAGGKICYDTASVVVPGDLVAPLADAGPNFTLTCSVIELQLMGNGSMGPQYSYLWTASNGGNITAGETTLTPTINADGTYKLKVTNNLNGCTAVSVTVVNSQTDSPTASASGGTYTCSTPSVTLQSTTNAVNPSYAWTGPNGFTSGLQNPTVNVAGAYTVVVTDGVTGCTNSATATVIANNAAPDATAAGDTLTCAVTNVTLQSSTTAANPTYAWAGPNGFTSNQPTPTVNAAGTYTLVVTDGLTGCTNSATATVVANNDTPGATAAGDTLTCTVTSVILQSSTTAANPAYAWTGPGGFTSGQPTPIVTVAGIYTLVVTDGLTGCTNSATAAVDLDNAAPGATAAGGTLTCAVTSITLQSMTNTANPTYAWTGPNGFTSNQSNPTVAADGTYQLVVTGTNGCTSSATAVVLLDNDVPGAAVSVSGILNCNNTAVNLVASSNADPATLQHVWTLPDASTLNTGTTAVLSANQPGAYSVVVTNTVNGCTSTANASVTQNAPVTAALSNQQNVSCSGLANGSLTVSAAGGDANYSYAWTNGDDTATADSLVSGTYLVTITDGDGCSTILTATITQPATLMANAAATPQTSNGSADGSATANPSGGTAGYTYLWDTGDTTSSLSGLLPDSYTVIVTDNNGCTAVQTVTVNAYNCLIQVAVSTTDVRCFGENNGAATVSITGGTAPFTYDWSTGDTTASISGLAPGLYSVSILDAANCPVELSATIAEPTLLNVNATATGTSGPNVDDGTATASPTGGVAPYTYAWSNGDDAAVADSLTAGDYTVTVSDANGCTAEQTVTVEPGNCGLLTEVLTTNPACNGQAGGTATVVVTGGNGAFTYAWSSGGDQATETGLGAGIYAVIVTDDQGCEVTDTAVVTEPPLLEITSVTTTTTTCPTNPEGTATVVAGGGTDSLTILWENAQFDFTATGLVAGTYSATVTDANGCTAVATAVVDALDTIAPLIVGDTTTLSLGPSGEVTLTPQNVGATITDNCVVANISIAPNEFDCAQLGPHEVVIEVTDEAGNISTDTMIIIIVDDAAPVMECPDSQVRCSGDDVVQYDSPTASDNCLGIGGGFEFVAGLPSGSTFPEGVTTNIFTYTDAQGNVGLCSFDITVLTPLAITVENVTPDNGLPNNGAIDITVSGSLPPYSYTWFLDGSPLSDTTEDLTDLGGGVYTVQVTDANDCVVASQDIVVESLVDADMPDWASAFGLFPNPSSGFVYVTLPNLLLDAETRILVFDATGRRILEQFNTREARIELDLSGQADGLYSVLIHIDGRSVAKKLVLSQ